LIGVDTLAGVASIPGSHRRRRGRAVDRRSSLVVIAAAAALGIAVGVVLEYFLDPRAGRRRRHTNRDRARSQVRHGRRRALRRVRRAESHAVGVARRALAARRRENEPIDDVTLAHEVEGRLHRDAGVPRGRLTVNAEDGVVFLRGVLDRQEDIRRAGEAAQRTPGVRGVENLIHEPGTPSPASRSRLERGGFER
jgi:hypothetical protein